MPRGLWKGSISFGMVNIPVSLHPGEVANDLSFDLVDRRDFSPIGYLKINKTTGQEVPREEMLRTYRLESGEVVAVTDEDLKKARPEAAQTLRILSFTDLAQIKPQFFDTPYYLEPAGKDSTAYVLLRDALAKTRKAGIGKVVIRTRERLAALVAEGPFLMLQTLRFAHQLRDPSKLKKPAGKADAAGLKMAERLIEEMVGPWKPGQFREEYRDQVLAYVREKAAAGKAREVREAPARGRKEAPVADLMSLLKRSVESARRSKSA